MMVFFAVLNSSMSRPSFIALLAALLWEILSVLISPCHLRSVPLIITYINNKEKSDTKTAFNLSLFFGLGLLIVRAVIGDVFSGARFADSWYKNFNGWVLTTGSCRLSGLNIEENRKIAIPNSEIVFAENELKRLSLEGYFKGVDSLVILFGEPESNSISSLRIVNLQNREEIKFVDNIPYNEAVEKAVH